MQYGADMEASVLDAAIRLNRVRELGWLLEMMAMRGWELEAEDSLTLVTTAMNLDKVECAEVGRRQDCGSCWWR